MTAPRIAGKLGRLTAQFPAGLRELPHYAAGPLPRPPASVPVPDVANWGMDGNDKYGDCGWAGLDHGFKADAAATGESETWPTAQQIVDAYLVYTGGQDGGVVLSQLLAYIRANGYFGHTISAYAPVAVSDVCSLQATIGMYEGAYCGITVTEAMQQAFEAGKPWTLADLASPVAGGHCIWAAGYDDQFLRVVTWGAVQEVTWPAWHAMASEAWAILAGELDEGDGRGISYTALKADLDRLDPVPRARVAPDPRNGLAELARLVRTVAASADADISEIVTWLRQRGL